MKSNARRTAVMPNALTNQNPKTAGGLTKAQPINLDSKAREAALESFIASVKKRFEDRFPGMAYDSPRYDFRQQSGQTNGKGERQNWQEVHQTNLQISKPNLVEGALKQLHPSFSRAARALLANQVLQDKGRNTDRFVYGLRLLAQLVPLSDQTLTLTLHDLTLEHLTHIERCVLTACLTPETTKVLQQEKFTIDDLIVPGVEMQGLSAQNGKACLHNLYNAIAVLLKENVISRMNARFDPQVKELLLAIQKHQGKVFLKEKEDELGPGITALSDAIAAMADRDDRLSEMQQAVLCVMGIEMCAPSRINEVIAMSINDRLRAVDAYDEDPAKDSDTKTMTESLALHRGHAGIKEASVPNAMDTMPNTVLMKGSKGAKWGPKPVLGFMLLMFNSCFDRLIEMGKRSRLLLEHYEKYPERLYLPPELEHLRGKPLTAIQIGRIMQLDGDLGSDAETFKAKVQAAKVMVNPVYKALFESKLFFTLDQKPDFADKIVDERKAFIDAQSKNGNAETTQKLSNTDSRTVYAEWSSVENELLQRVKKQMDSIPWVTNTTRYQGRLSNMLMLCDHTGRNPAYLPGVLSSKDVASGLNSINHGANKGVRVEPRQTVFEALGLTMLMLSEDGTRHELVTAYCRTHDPRRWLTTMALRHAGPELSRLLINLWANRADVGQLNAYDYRTTEEKAALTTLDVPQDMLLVPDNELSLVMQDELINKYELKTQSISVGLHTIRVTTMDAIHSAEMDHPVAKAGDKVILIFPTPFGACLHQHHEIGCTNYRGCGGACSDQRVIKGHLPTNEQVRKQADNLHDVIVAQVNRLTFARNRSAVHDLDKLDEHLTKMIMQHMDDDAIASRLIADFDEIKHLIKDAAFKADLEDAYAFKGKVERLDDPNVSSGAVIRYYNPERHGRPETERTIEALGGRKELEKEVKTFLQERDYMRLENRAASDDDGDVELAIEDEDDED